MSEGGASGDPAAHRFHCTEGERAAFEAGIKLGTIFHQYVGMPLSLENLSSLETAIRGACLVQPYVIEASIRIDPSGLGKKEGEYNYTTLTPERLDVLVVIVYGGSKMRARLAYDDELDYPLMWLEDTRCPENI
ncbi:MAG: dihydroneopterin aldolase family protein [Thermoplasmata archaeon]|nr:dihydroneopterin aldolase family protein [Thermoplasmata archaeon]